MPTDGIRAPLLLAQLTDTHIVSPETREPLYVDNNGRLAAAVESLIGERPTMDAVLGTGDLVNDAAAAEYDTLRQLVAPLPVPFLPIPGNHDDRDLLRSTFPDTPWIDADHASWVATVRGGLLDGGPRTIRVIGLDSTIPGEPGAEFDADRESWLRSVLADDRDVPTVLAMHHPPFSTGISWMDRAGFIGLDRLADVLTEFPVLRVMCGHLHRPITSSIAGVTAQVCLSTVQQIDLDLSPEAGMSLILDPVGYQIHRVGGPAGAPNVASHTRFIETGQAAFSPDWADAAPSG
ncbi:MAG: phosphodiesterase [Actinomycetota bacterium]